MSSIREATKVTPNVLDEIVARTLDDPDHLAASDLERELSYAGLIDEVARVGSALRARNVAEGDRVALLIANSVDFIVASLATLWIGAVFVPLAVTDPLTRVRSIIEDLEPEIIITASTGNDVPQAAFPRHTVVALDELRNTECDPESPSEPQRVAYMIYTSGTTGKPKGVQIGHGAFSAAVHSTVDALGLNRTSRTLLVSPFHFDGSYANLFTTLVAGGTVIIRPRDALLYPRTFFNTVAKESITYSGFTPSYLRLLLASPQISTLGESTLKSIALGGEAVTVADLRALWAAAPSIRVFNRYGPTETTIAVTNVELTPTVIEDGVVPIGRPHPGVTFDLIDDGGRIVTSHDRTAELFIGGVQLMEGYWADPLLTATVMRRDIVPDRTLYRTGDLVYRRDDGNFVYVDRADRVIKRSGVRISLLELSTAIGTLEHVTAASCLAFDQDGEMGIVAFVVVDSDATTLELRRGASAVLPANMLPDRIELIAAMPLNRSNALDEAALLASAGLRPFSAANRQSPSNN